MTQGNLLAGIPLQLPDELTERLIDNPSVRIERIVSQGHRSAPDEWYDQTSHEFVLLVAGAARLEIAGQGEMLLEPGDWVNLPARQRHRVSWTSPDEDTVWLAIFY